MAIAAHDEPEPLMGTSLLAPAGAAVMTSGITIASAGTAAHRVMAERNMALVIAFSREGAGAAAGRRGHNSGGSDLASHTPASRIVTPLAQDNKHETNFDYPSRPLPILGANGANSSPP